MWDCTSTVFLFTNRFLALSLDYTVQCMSEIAHPWWLTVTILSSSQFSEVDPGIVPTSDHPASLRSANYDGLIHPEERISLIVLRNPAEFALPDSSSISSCMVVPTLVKADVPASACIAEPVLFLFPIFVISCFLYVTNLARLDTSDGDCTLVAKMNAGLYDAYGPVA